MKSMFRIYAKTSKPNDKYLYNELLQFGLKPKYEDLLHSFYFNATFEQLFKLSFQSFTAESMYLQLGQKYHLSTGVGENQSSFLQCLKKINFRNYIPLQRNIVENTALKILIRQSSLSLPSENALISILQNHLQKQVILKQYRKLVKNQGTQPHHRLQNYYDIKHIIEKKWTYQDQMLEQQQQQKLLASKQNRENTQFIEGQANYKYIQNVNNKLQNITSNNVNHLTTSLEVPYSPHFLLYIRRNHARLLLKINKQSMHKFGWKKNVGWGPIRQTLTASILYRTGLVDYAKQQKQITLWDPFCGSMTIPLVALSMFKSLKVRQDVSNFVWQKWPVYNPAYLGQYQQKLINHNRQINVNVFGSDIDIKAVKNSVNNFQDFIQANNKQFQIIKQKTSQNFIKLNPSDQIYEIIPNNIYVGCGDFQQLAQKIASNPAKKISIVTNLPYLGQRSKQHHQLNQLQSIYKRFNKMITKYKQNIDNIFVIVDAEIKNHNHFIRISNNNQWSILEYFNNGGIEVCLLGWAHNKVGWKQIQVYSQNKNIGETYTENKTKNLQQYRNQIKQIQNKRYYLPAHLDKNKKLRSTKRVLEQKRVRHLRAAYQLFTQRKDKRQIFQRYQRKNLVLRLSQRGKTWRRKNMGLIGSQIESKQAVIKKQFESRIEQALKRSEEMKQKKKLATEKPKRKW